MAKSPRSFRIDDKDLELIDTMVKHFSELHGIDHTRPTILTMAIRKLAFENLKEEIVRDILDK